MRVVLRKKDLLAQDTFSFEFVPVEGIELPRFSAGAHIDVEPVAGIVRQYSICNSPEERNRYVIAVLRAPESRGGSSAMHSLAVGDTVNISSPRNNFGLAEGASRSLLIAGGIGVTPILCMAEQLLSEGAHFEFHYCARDMDRVAFRERLGAPDMLDRVRLHLDSVKTDGLDMVQLAREHGVADTHVYVCGPSGFIDFVLDSARVAGFPDCQLHREYFALDTGIDRAEDNAFTVRIASSGEEIPVSAGESVIDALASRGIKIPVSCEQGVCGTCLTRILEGTPLHRDVYLTDSEKVRGDQFTPCCSRALSPLLVLDI